MNKKQIQALRKLIAEIEEQTILFNSDNWPKYRQICIEWGDKVAPFITSAEKREFNKELDMIRTTIHDPYLSSDFFGDPNENAFNKMKGIAKQRLQELEHDINANNEPHDAIHLPSKVNLGWLFKLLRRLSIGSWSLIITVVAGAYALGQGQETFFRFFTTTSQNQQRNQSGPTVQTVMTTAKISDMKSSSLSAVDLSELQQLRTSIAEKDSIANSLRADIESLKEKLDQSAKGHGDVQRISRTQEEQVKVLKDRLAQTEANLLQKEKSYSACVKKLEQAVKASHLDSIPKKSSNIRRAFFDSNVLKIDVISFEESGPNYHLLLKHTNKSGQPLVLIAFKHKDETFLYNDDGMQFNYVSIHAAGRNNELELSDLGGKVEIAPGGSKVLSFNFSRADTSKNGMYSFSSKYGYCLNLQCRPYTPLYVSIKGMQLD